MLSTEGSSQMRLAFVHNDSINANYLFIQEEQKRLDGKSKASDARIEQVVKETEYYDLINYLQNAPEKDIPMAQELVYNAEMRIASVRQEEAEKLSRYQMEHQDELSRRVNAFLDEYCANEGITLLFNYAPGLGNLLYSSEVLDVTKEVVDGLNRVYLDEQNSMEK